MSAKLIGRSVTRLEDPPLLTGAGCFAADVSFPHQLHMRVVRSAYAHARLVAIDTRSSTSASGAASIGGGADSTAASFTGAASGCPFVLFEPHAAMTAHATVKGSVRTDRGYITSPPMHA